MKHFSDIVRVMKGLSDIRFFALWVVLLLIASTPFLFGVARVIEALSK